MRASLFSSGLVLPRSGPVPAWADAPTTLTPEAALTASPNEGLRVELMVAEDAQVAQGQPVLRLRAAPDVALVAPMAGRITRVDLLPGHRLSQLVVFQDEHNNRHAFDTKSLALPALLQSSGLWHRILSRPFGRMPRATETPAAIFVMGIDTTPDAPPPWAAIAGREEDFSRGMGALTDFAAKLFMCEPANQPCPADLPATVTRLSVAPIHPQGLAGWQIHRHFPATPAAPVWEVHAEDVADIGALLATGYLPATRLVSITGDALHAPSAVRCQPGADLRGLCQSLLRPGPHEVLSGSILNGRPAHWLGPHDRQATLLACPAAAKSPHWFATALERAARHAPIIPSAALDQSLGGALPAAALIRALATADTEGFTRLGGLSLLASDIALADYATGARPRLATQLRAMLHKIAAEEDAL
ncbi:Na(+)-translocating NADH-quinone reductase subunit A [Pseudorhodobacter sp. W20_MBD10_FR17]|uniref:Na(+)-translocating NADH-quinone reductase subunit A n=1 Tax=Pseudorhodobacter sp. W20_MBD10_FR17 TaxID=3240266 RepID=UPI003F94813E